MLVIKTARQLWVINNIPAMRSHHAASVTAACLPPDEFLTHMLRLQGHLCIPMEHNAKRSTLSVIESMSPHPYHQAISTVGATSKETRISHLAVDTRLDVLESGIMPAPKQQISDGGLWLDNIVRHLAGNLLTSEILVWADKPKDAENAVNALQWHGGNVEKVIATLFETTHGNTRKTHVYLFNTRLGVTHQFVDSDFIEYMRNICTIYELTYGETKTLKIDEVRPFTFEELNDPKPQDQPRLHVKIIKAASSRDTVQKLIEAAESKYEQKP